MKILTVVASFTFLMAGCSGTAPISTPSATSAKAPDVSDQIRKSLDQAALNDVSIKQDRDKGVVTLGGHVPSDNDRSRAESIAKDIANGQVVSNEIGVIPPAIEDKAKKVNSDHDKAIAKNLDAALVQNGLKEDVRYDVTLVQIRIWFCEVKKAEHLLACGWALEKPIATLRRLSLDSSQQYFLTNSAVDSSFRI